MAFVGLVPKEQVLFLKVNRDTAGTVLFLLPLHFSKNCY